MEEAQNAKTSIVQKLLINTEEVKNLEIVSDKSCVINGTAYDDLSSSTLDLLRRLAASESQLVSSGKPMQKRPHSAKTKQQQLPAHPLAMVRPVSVSSSNAPRQIITLKPFSNKGTPTERKTKSSSSTSTEATKVPQAIGKQIGGTQRQTTNEKKDVSSSGSSSSLEDTDSSNSDEDVAAPTTPVVSGPLPPPLKDIPHINPESPVTSQVFPYSGDSAGSTIPKAPLSPASKGPIPVSISVLPPPVRQPKLLFPIQPSIQQDPQAVAKPLQPQAIIERSPSHPTTPSGDQPSPQPTSQNKNSIVKQSSPQTITQPLLVPVQTSTPVKAKRSLFPEVNKTEALTPSLQSQKSEPQSTAVDSEPAEHQTVATPPNHASTTASTQKQPSHSEPVRTAGIPHGAKKPPSGSARQRKRRQRHRQPSISSSDEEETESSDSLTSDSESGLSDEARDTFDPRIQQRRLPLQPMRPIGQPVVPAIGGLSRAHLPVLPPIASQASQINSSGSLPPLQGPGTLAHHFVMAEKYPMPHSALHQLKPLGNPPAYYQEASGGTLAASNRNRGLQENIPNHGSGGLDENDMSNDEIHMSALEGVRSSHMKDLALQYGVDYRDQGGRTPLMYAVIGNQPKMCEVLLKLKASINAKDASGFSALLWATYHAKPDVMKVLLRNHSVDVKCCDSDGRNIYHWAMKTPNIQCLKLICKYTKNMPSLVNQIDKEGLTPLHWAVMSDQASHIRLLLTSTSADVSIQDKEGRTPLNYAVLNFSPPCIRAIADNFEGALNVIDAKGRTVLHYACAEGHAECVRTLLSYHRCDLHCTDNKGTTPLHWAAAANQIGVVQLLLRRGADRSQRDISDKTPLDYAQERGHTECVKILQTYGLRRPMSAISLVSRSSLHGATLSTLSLDDHGHVQLKRPKRKFSLSGESVTSFTDRQPADGQAQETRSEENQPTVNDHEDEDQDKAEQRNEQQVSSSAMVSEDANEQWAESRQPQNNQLERIQTPTTTLRTETRTSWLFLFCAKCSSQRNNAVAPVN